MYSETIKEQGKDSHLPPGTGKDADCADPAICEMVREDIRAGVLAIERDAFMSPWSENMFLRELCLPFSRNLVARVCTNGLPEIAGYVNVWLFAGEMHIHNLAVKKTCRRRGIASALLREMMNRGRREGASVAFLEVRRSNDDAKRLYARLGFEIRGERPRYYTDTKEDALLMTADLGKIAHAD